MTEWRKLSTTDKQRTICTRTLPIKSDDNLRKAVSFLNITEEKMCQRTIKFQLKLMKLSGSRLICSFYTVDTFATMEIIMCSIGVFRAWNSLVSLHHRCHFSKWTVQMKYYCESRLRRRYHFKLSVKLTSSDCVAIEWQCNVFIQSLCVLLYVLCRRSHYVLAQLCVFHFIASRIDAV